MRSQKKSHLDPLWWVILSASFLVKCGKDVELYKKLWLEQFSHVEKAYLSDHCLVIAYSAGNPEKISEFLNWLIDQDVLALPVWSDEELLDLIRRRSGNTATFSSTDMLIAGCVYELIFEEFGSMGNLLA